MQKPSPDPSLAPRACPTCGDAYQPYRASQRACSRRCRDRKPAIIAAQRTWNARPENRERKNAARRVATNPARRAINLRSNLAQYGITPVQYDEMLAAQDGRCAICSDPPDPNGRRAYSRLHVDHDHDTRAVRALLCGRCNQGLGYFRDDPARLSLAAAYLARHKSPVVVSAAC